MLDILTPYVIRQITAGFIFFFLSAPYVYAEASKSVKIESYPENAAIYLVDRGKWKLTGNTPSSINLNFRSNKSSHDLIINKLGYELFEKTIKYNDNNIAAKLKKIDLLAAPEIKDSPPRHLYAKIRDAINLVVYKKNFRTDEINLIGKLRIVPSGDQFALNVETAVLEEKTLKSIRKYSRGGKSLSKQKKVAGIILDKSKLFVHELAKALKDIKEIKYIDLIVNYPVKKGEIKFSRYEIPQFVQNTYTSYHDGYIVETTISGWTYSVLDSSDVYWTKKTYAMRFITPKNVLLKNNLNHDAIISHSLILLRNIKKGKFEEINFSTQ